MSHRRADGRWVPRRRDRCRGVRLRDAPDPQRARDPAVPAAVGGHGGRELRRLALAARAHGPRDAADQRLPGAELRARRRGGHQAAPGAVHGATGRGARGQVRPPHGDGHLRRPQGPALPVDPARGLAVVAVRRHLPHRALRAVLDPGQGLLGPEPAQALRPDRDGQPALAGDDLRRRGDQRRRGVRADLQVGQHRGLAPEPDDDGLPRARRQRPRRAAHRVHRRLPHPRDLGSQRGAPRGRAGPAGDAARRRAVRLDDAAGARARRRHHRGVRGRRRGHRQRPALRREPRGRRRGLLGAVHRAVQRPRAGDGDGAADGAPDAAQPPVRRRHRRRRHLAARRRDRLAPLPGAGHRRPRRLLRRAPRCSPA